MTNTYLEKIASFDEEYFVKLAEDLTELEKQAFFGALTRLFSRAPKTPKISTPPLKPAQPSSTPHNGTIAPKLSKSKEQMAAFSQKYKANQAAQSKTRINRLASGVESKLGAGGMFKTSSERKQPNYLIPAMTAGVPVAAMGAARAAELAIRNKHAKPDDIPMYKELRKGNLRTALALTGAAGVAAAGAEAYRQHLLDEKQKNQTRNIQVAIKRVVENQ